MISQDTTENTIEASKRKIAGSAGWVALGTFISRILGFIRDMVLANIFGATRAADAFYVAFRIPNMLRELFAEGSMSAGFIPVFTRYLQQKSKTDAKELASAAFTVLLFTLSLIVSVGMIFSPQIVTLMAPGFLKSAQQFQLTVQLTQIMFPFLLLVSVAALLMGILNSSHRFGPPSMASGTFNVVSILFVMGTTPYLAEPAYGAAIGVVLGGLAQCAIQLPALYKEGFSLTICKPTWPFHPGVIQMGKLILPISLGLSVTQINIFVNTLLASYLPEGSVSYLYYGMRLIHFPLGIFAVAIATAILPTLSAQASQKDMASLRQTFSFGLRFAFFMTFPAMIGLMVLRVPIVHLLFEHGEFTSVATQGTADAVLFYAVGLWAFSGIRVIAQGFYALQDTKTPVMIGLITVLMNIVLNLLLMRPLLHGGLALATALSAIFNFTALLIILNRRLGKIDTQGIISSHMKVLAASLTMMLPLLWIANQPIWQAADHWGIKGMVLSAAILLGAAAYFLVQALLKADEVYFLWGLVRERMAGKK